MIIFNAAAPLDVKETYLLGLLTGHIHRFDGFCTYFNPCGLVTLIIYCGRDGNEEICRVEFTQRDLLCLDTNLRFMIRMLDNSYKGG